MTTTAAGDDDDKNLGRQINRILFDDWDPIGINSYGGPSDEYSSYVPSVLRLLKDGASNQRIIDMLSNIAQESIGVSSNPGVKLAVAQKLQALMSDSISSSQVDLRVEDARLVIPPISQPSPSRSSLVVSDEDRRLRCKVSAILFRDWDPIGVNDCAPSDEYEDYVPSVLRLLKAGANVQQLGALLHDIAKEAMLMDTTTEFNTSVAQKLCALMDSSQVHHDERTIQLKEGRRFNPRVIQPRFAEQEPSTTSTVVSDEDRLLGYKISAILFNDWDPIGMNDFGLLPDEYDVHVPSILRLLKDGANEVVIGMKLQEIASEKMGLRSKAQVDILVAQKLRALIMENQGAVAERNINRMEHDRSYIPPTDSYYQRSSSSLSSDMENKDARIRRKINTILFHDWNPIGYDGMPEDEYSSYVPSVLRLLKDGASVQTISDLLHKIGKESIGMNTKAEVNMSVAMKLQTLMDHEVFAGPRNQQPQGEEYPHLPRYYGTSAVYPGPYYSSRDAQEYRLRGEINDVLYYAWDPIGMTTCQCPHRDEYRTYVPRILPLMKDGATVEQISKELHKIAKEMMRIDTKEEVNTLVAQKLRALMHGGSHMY